jgi:hypothetical protein
LIKKRREECIVLLDDCFDCKSVADALTSKSIKVCRFAVEFPAAHNPEVREQRVKDSRVIRIAATHKYLLFTSDTSMREVHSEQLLKTDLAVIAAATNHDKKCVDDYTKAFIESKAKIMRDFRGKLDRPYFCILQKSGKVEPRPIKAPYQRQSNPKYKTTSAD